VNYLHIALITRGDAVNRVREYDEKPKTKNPQAKPTKGR